MNDLQIFENSEFGKVRTTAVNGEVMFVGKDVADILGYQNGSRDINRHVDEEDRYKVMIFDGNQDKETIIINESGLYSLILSSKMPNARKFKHWVTAEVLPSIRKHGVYAVDELLNNPELAIKAFTALKEERAKNKTLQEENDRMRPKEVFADAVATSHTSILIGDLAKLLKQNGVDIGQKRLFIWMRDNGYLIKRKGSDWNMPTQKSMELGLFEVKESTVNNPDGSVRISKTTKVTGKGQQYFINKFLGEVA
ncbi:MAG: phage antirepressor KilAC domain-containing protein [Roseburia sp.]|nr:phage antirepressor KilAC domain-containing protein [Roseburia sp.]